MSNNIKRQKKVDALISVLKRFKRYSDKGEFTFNFLKSLKTSFDEERKIYTETFLTVFSREDKTSIAIKIEITY